MDAKLPPKKRITMKDIARMVHVSRPVVSVVLNNPANSTIRVSQDKRKAILDIATNEKYSPNPAAMILNKKKQNYIAVFYTSSLFDTAVALFREYTIQFRLKGYQVLHIALTDPQQEIEQINYLASIGVSGFLFFSSILRIPHKNLPVPAIYEFEFSDEADRGINRSSARSIYGMTRHLLEHGHRKSGLIGRHFHVGNNHETEWRRALKEAGIEPADSWALPLAWNADFAAQLHHLIDVEQVRAFHCISDWIAIFTEKWLLSEGYRIPEDVALTTSDGTFLSDAAPVSLTTAAYDVVETAKAKVDLLIRKINDNVFESDPAETEVMMKYRIAHSCGCPEKKMKLILWEYQDRSIIEYRRPTYPLPEELHPEYPLMTEDEFLSWRLPLQK